MSMRGQAPPTNTLTLSGALIKSLHPALGYGMMKISTMIQIIPLDWSELTDNNGRAALVHHKQGIIIRGYGH